MHRPNQAYCTEIYSRTKGTGCLSPSSQKYPNFLYEPHILGCPTTTAIHNLAWIATSTGVAWTVNCSIFGQTSRLNTEKASQLVKTVDCILFDRMIRSWTCFVSLQNSDLLFCGLSWLWTNGPLQKSTISTVTTIPCWAKVRARTTCNNCTPWWAWDFESELPQLISRDKSGCYRYVTSPFQINNPGTGFCTVKPPSWREGALLSVPSKKGSSSCICHLSSLKILPDTSIIQVQPTNLHQCSTNPTQVGTHHHLSPTGAPNILCGSPYTLLDSRHFGAPCCRA